uniref:Uncharacterized protein n=1 Tax=Arundo donax TaxID=35708 RepID=A0A0A9FTC7_ARUDO
MLLRINHCDRALPISPHHNI